MTRSKIQKLSLGFPFFEIFEVATFQGFKVEAG